MSFPVLAIIGFLFGVGFGYFVQRAGLCYAHGLAEIYMGKGKRIFRIFTIMFIITALGFLLSGYLFPKSGLGLKVVGQIRGEGFFNILSGLLFGAGILLNGGCVLGTLRQIGEGNMTFLVVLISFIPGMALVAYWLDPLLKNGYNIRQLLLPQLLGVPPFYVTGILALGCFVWYMFIRRRK